MQRGAHQKTLGCRLLPENIRLAVRKQRDGLSGFEIPFTARMAETGTDEDGDPVTAQGRTHVSTRLRAEQSERFFLP